MMKREFLTFDNPDKRDYTFEELAAGEGEQRPRHEVTVYDQGRIGACTRFALGHIYNGNNINEYKKNGEKFKQVNPMEWRDKGIKFKSLQSALAEFKKRGLIEGRTVIKGDKIAGVKRALSMGYFIYTGSEDGLWGIYRSPRNYQKRKDGKIMGHAWSIVGDEPENERFVIINSFGTDWGDDGYFYLPYKDINSCFSLNVIIDKDNSGEFKLLKQKEKAKQFVALAKELYTNGDPEVRKFFEDVQLSNFISNKYSI